MKRHAITDFKNIRVLPSGYQVALVRSGNEFSRHFAGHSAQSWQAAVRFRDQALRELPDKRINKVPRRVLSALHLTRPVVGVFRHPGRTFYHVTYHDKDRSRGKAFSWGKLRSETEAYAAAIAFRKKSIRGLPVKGGGRGPRKAAQKRASS